MVSSFLAGYVYSKTQYSRGDQIEVFFNHTRPKHSQTSLSAHFFYHQFKLEELTIYSSFCFGLSIISAFLLLLSTLSTPPGVSIRIAFIAFSCLLLGYILSKILIAIVHMWRHRSSLVYNVRQEGIHLDPWVVVWFKSKFPWSESIMKYSTSERDQFILSSGPKIIEEDMKMRVYSASNRNSGEIIGTLKGSSATTRDKIYRMMVRNGEFDLFLKSGDLIREYRNCTGEWDGREEIRWNCSQVITHS